MPLTDQQREAAERIADNLCVVAGAGTGKTRVLVDRYLRLLSDGKASPEDIAAITFTRKAAAEMTSRLRSECAKRAAEAPSIEKKRVWQQRLGGLAASTIDTIHGFCSDLVRQFPVEARVDPQFRVMDEGQQPLLLGDSIRSTVRRLLDEGCPDILVAARAYGLRALLDMLAKAMGRRAAVLGAGATLDVPLDEMLARLQRAVDAAIGQAACNVLSACRREAGLVRATGGPADDLAEVAREQAAEALAMLESGQPAAARLDGLRILTGVTLRGGSAKKWRSKEMLDEVKAVLKTLKEAARDGLASCDVSDPADWPGELELARSLMRVVLAAVEDYERAKVALGVLDYDDLLLKARDLLRGSDAARRSLGGRFRQVLVDELQDTDALQVEILALLLGDEAAGDFSPRPGTFFGVGDPKQSIYRFRGADVAGFHRIAAGFGERGVVPLSKTFRFHRGLAAVTNTVFSRTLGDEFSPLEADREAPAAACVEVLLVPDGSGLKAEDRRFREAARLAQRIRALVDNEGVGWGDIAILMHRQTQSYAYEDALTRLGIPSYVVSGRHFYEQQEIRDVIVALRAVRNPGDILALASLLRSPLFGISDDALYALCRRGLLSRMLAEPQAADGLAPDDAAKLSRAAAWLAHYSSRAGRVGVAQLTEEMVFDGVEAGAASQGGLAHLVLPQFLGQRRYANLRRLVDRARQLDRSGAARLEDFLETLELSIAEGVEEAAAPLSEEGRDAVLMMTVHKAKGLEFPYVFLVNADAGLAGPRESLYVSTELGLAPRRPDRRVTSSNSAAFTLLQNVDARADVEEYKRLFYVAATRAKERLVISGSQKIARDSWLDWLGSAVGVSLADEPEGRREVDLADGATVAIDVAAAEPLRIRHHKAVGPVAALFRDGMVDHGALDKLSGRKGASSRAATWRRRIAPVHEDCASLTLSVTAVADYDRCPALFRFRHVLGLDGVPGHADGDGGRREDAAAIGDIVHAYLRVANLGHKTVDCGLVSRLVEQDRRIGRSRRAAVAEAVAGLVANAGRIPFAEQVAASRTVLREVPFVLAVDGFALKGTIDLLFQDDHGEWRLIDYKTDGVSREEARNHALRNRTQLLIYAKAAEKFLGTKLKSACLAFLSAGIIECIGVESGLDTVTSLLSGIAAHRFGPVVDCAGPCAYRELCLRTASRTAQQ